MIPRWLQVPVLVLLGALGASFFAGSAAGQHTPALIRGGGSAGVIKEPVFRFQTVGGQRTSAQFDRNALKVPAHFGQCIAVTQAGQKPVLWYQDNGGTLRNVILSDARMLVQISAGQ